ncbi:ribonuclease HI family protein [Aggregicoccus sp. 17bor-14]|uniref:ribonuclease HI family protein n=1 Tax=Myxococcaceae TaxID=31 RepID=UPI00129D119A|nr:MULTISPECIES: ribonuclease HI family protein [Myxococcaceae]MBF5044296.1 ribonuclease HI family protein [Simulacricoccus sp. 17bor-14]MRI90045.1 ribonuclease HI family protein [Aggregicoccus sp. 17bor-14]
MPLPSEAELLRHIAREEPLTQTVRAFRGLTRERLGQLLEQLADTLAQQPGGPEAELPHASPPAPAAPPPPPPAAATDGAALGRVRVYSDGAARGNPGPSGAGAVVTDAGGGTVLARVGKYLGRQTNNYAEYMGLIIGLKHARELGAREVDVYADSELMIRQLGGRYQVKSPTLRPLFDEAVRLLKGFAKVKLVHVPREQNALADEMSNRAIDERM